MSETSTGSTADAPMATPGSSGEPTTGETDTDGTGSTGSTGGPGGTGSAGGSLCEMFAENVATCDPETDTAELAAECEAQKASAGPECMTAFEVYLECSAGVSCEDTATCEAAYFDYLACQSPVGESCSAYGAKLEECMQIPASEGGGVCQQQLDQLEPTPACHDAYEAFIVCYSMLTCADIEREVGCEAELTAFAGCDG